MLSKRIAAKAREALGLNRWGELHVPSQSVIGRDLDLSKKTISRYEVNGAPERYRYEMIGYLFAAGLDPRSVKGLVPDRPPALARWERDLRGAA